jgi:hypothetical protein
VDRRGQLLVVIGGLGAIRAIRGWVPDGYRESGLKPDDVSRKWTGLAEIQRAAAAHNFGTYDGYTDQSGRAVPRVSYLGAAAILDFWRVHAVRVAAIGSPADEAGTAGQDFSLWLGHVNPALTLTTHDGLLRARVATRIPDLAARLDSFAGAFDDPQPAWTVIDRYDPNGSLTAGEADTFWAGIVKRIAIEIGTLETLPDTSAWQGLMGCVGAAASDVATFAIGVAAVGASVVAQAAAVTLPELILPLVPWIACAGIGYYLIRSKLP